MQQEQGMPRRPNRSPRRPKSQRFQPVNERLWTPELRARFNNAYCHRQQRREKAMTEQDREKQRRLDREGEWRSLEHKYWTEMYKKFTFSETQVRSYGEKYEKACQRFRDYNRRRVKYGVKHLYGRTRSSSNERSGNISPREIQFLQAKDIARFINGLDITRLEREVIIDRQIWRLACYSSSSSSSSAVNVSPQNPHHRQRTRSPKNSPQTNKNQAGQNKRLGKNPGWSARQNLHIRNGIEENKDMLALSPLVLSFNQQIFKQMFGSKNRKNQNRSQR